MRYDKLVRDKIPEIIRANGGTPIVRVVADEAELRRRLTVKLDEEVEEFFKHPSLEELADIVEVVNTLAETMNSSPEAIEWLRHKKAMEKGGFSEGVILKEA